MSVPQNKYREAVFRYEPCTVFIADNISEFSSDTVSAFILRYQLVCQYPLPAYTVLSHSVYFFAHSKHTTPGIHEYAALKRRVVDKTQTTVVLEHYPCYTFFHKAYFLHLFLPYGWKLYVHIYKGTLFCIKQIQIIVGRQAPQVSVTSFLNVEDSVGGYRAAGILHRLECIIVVSVVTNEPVPCGKPHEPILVLHGIRHMGLKQSVS